MHCPLTEPFIVLVVEQAKLKGGRNTNAFCVVYLNNVEVGKTAVVAHSDRPEWRKGFTLYGVCGRLM